MPNNVNSSRFKVPKSPQRNIYQITKWLGCDFTSSPSAVDENHSQECINFTRYMPGKIRKRMGYTNVGREKDGHEINDIWKWDDNCYLIHARNRVYSVRRDSSTGNFDFENFSQDENSIFLYGGYVPFDFGYKQLSFHRMKDTGIIFGDGLFGIIEWRDQGYVPGGNFVIYEHEHGGFKEHCHVPVVTISKSPTGGGRSYEAVNMLVNTFTDSFYVSSSESSATDFYTSFKPLSEVISVEVLDANGEWVDVPSTAQGYRAILNEGKIIFYTPPGASPIEGEDNVRITASTTAIESQIDKLSSCTIGIAYGVGGEANRIFLSGNEEYPNYDWFSEMDDITYFPDNNYSVLGSDASAIKGYAIASNYLVTLKGEGTDQQTAIIREGVLDNDGNVVFRVINSLQGHPILSGKTSVMAGVEPLFLSKEGVMAITSEDITGEKMMNSRSYFINGKLLKEPALENSFAIRHGDFYLLFVNTHVYVLDTLQAITTDNAPYSTREYATFYWDNIPATCAASIDGAVFFGTDTGVLMKSYTDENSISSYSDCNKNFVYTKNPIHCKYVTADLDALIFFKLKTYRYFALKVFSSVASSVKIYCYRNGEWELLKEDAGTVRYFTFSQLVFSKLTFRTDLGTRLVNSKVRIKKLDHAKFMIENDVLEESLMIDEFGIEFTQSGNYKN